MGCHSVGPNASLPQKYGPFFKDIANKYKDKGENAVSLLKNSILRGSHHKWDRPINMQPRSKYGKTIDQANADTVAKWIMTLADDSVAVK
ncbi:MAG: hypothetical protein D3922_05535 [Candidatus Electrothrix sp. AR1]|nr:hypothetical protein [Candidatus Electrothrix sp. AR1]